MPEPETNLMPVPPQPTPFVTPQYAAPAGYQAPNYGQLPPGYAFAGEPTSPGGEPLAPFEKRIIARLVDGAILSGVGLVLVLPLYCLVFSMIDFGPGQADEGAQATLVLTFLGGYFLILVFLMIASYVYNVEMSLRAGGQTIGKRVAKIRIVPLDPSQTITRRHLAIRWVAEFGMALVPGLSWVDGLYQLWDKPYRQCLHDKAAKTVVVRLST
jgi:uncharacterized RDD family membrane protein YckC